MIARPSFARWIALRLTEHAACVLPATRSPWAVAMQHELHHIESDRQALTWAIGCVLASYVERSRVIHVIHLAPVRALLVLLIGGEVLSFLFATVLTAAYRLHYLGVATFLGRGTPGDDYRRFIPLMDAAPWWIHALWVGSAALLFDSAWQLLSKRRSAFPLFSAAWVLGTVGNLISQTMPEAREAFSFPAPIFTRDYLIPVATALLPVFIAAAVWAHDRCSVGNGLSQD
jgi:hypothetical protein